jgi:hypothetical protein
VFARRPVDVRRHIRCHGVQTRNFGLSGKALENRTGYPDSAGLTIPRVFVAPYEVRNRRAIGHVGGYVDANHMGADLVPAMSKWIVAEMVRLVYNTDVKTATDVVDPLIDRTLPALACGLDLAASAPTGAQSEACLTRRCRSRPREIR